MKSGISPLIMSYNSDSWVRVSVERYGEISPLKHFLFYVEDEGSVGSFAIRRDEYIASARYLFEHRDELESILGDFSVDAEALLTYVDRLETDPSLIRTEFPRFIERYNAMYSAGAMTDGFIVYSDIIVDEVRARAGVAADEVIGTLLQVPTLHFAQREKLGIMEIALTPEDEWDSLLRRHQRRFHWILNNYKDWEALPLEHFRERVTRFREEQTPEEIRALADELRSYESDHAEAVATMRQSGLLSEDNVERLLLLARIAESVDLRKACNLVGNHWIGRYISAMAESRGLVLRDVLLLLAEEFEAIVAGKLAIEDIDIQGRRREFGAVCRDCALHGYEGEVLTLLRQAIAAETVVETTEITGKVAYKGIVRGRVRVMDFPKQKEFLEGEVLVTSMTRPDFVPLMRRASAIVTNEGGITSHAAIVAREMKKPCIIGTKVATQLLHDGDLVEVDADHGVVRIVEQGK